MKGKNKFTIYMFAIMIFAGLLPVVIDLLI